MNTIFENLRLKALKIVLGFRGFYLLLTYMFTSYVC